MSSFTEDLIIKQINKKEWKVFKAFEYHIGSEGSNERIKIPASYITDGASIPRFLWPFVGHPLQEYAQAAVIHDFAYEYNLYPRKKCDLIFLEAMEVLNVGRIKRRIIYRAVRLFGWISHRKK